MNFLYLLKGAPAVPTARSNRCFAVATPLALRQQAVFSLPCLGGNHWLRTGRLLRLRVETASYPTVGSPSRSLGLAHYNRAPRLRGGYSSVAQLAQYTSARFSCHAPEFCDDGADACRLRPISISIGAGGVKSKEKIFYFCCSYNKNR